MRNFTLGQLLDQFDVTHHKLLGAVVFDQSELVTKLDSDLAELLSQILEYKPQTTADFTTICRFLVDQILQFDAHSTTKERMADQLIALIEEHVTNPPSTPT